MKIRISYFYQIRNFKKNMIPVSTCLSDPSWYHNYKDNDYIFKDKRDILNGLRLLPVIVQNKCKNICPICKDKDYKNCSFLKEYKYYLEKIDFEKMIKGIKNFSEEYKKQEKIEEEIVIVLIVYEAPNNKCSERDVLIDFFNNHGIECKELDYPII